MNFHYQVSILLLIIRVPPEITYEPYSDHISEEARNKLIIQINMNKGTPNQLLLQIYLKKVMPWGYPLIKNKEKKKRVQMIAFSAIISCLVCSQARNKLELLIIINLLFYIIFIYISLFLRSLLGGTLIIILRHDLDK